MTVNKPIMNSYYFLSLHKKWAAVPNLIGCYLIRIIYQINAQKEFINFKKYNYENVLTQNCVGGNFCFTFS